MRERTGSPVFSSQIDGNRAELAEGITRQHRGMPGGGRQSAQGGNDLIRRQAVQFRKGHSLDSLRQPRPAGYGRNASRYLKPDVNNPAIPDHRPQFHLVATSRICGLHHNRRRLEFADVARVVEMVQHLV